MDVTEEQGYMGTKESGYSYMGKKRKVGGTCEWEERRGVKNLDVEEPLLGVTVRAGGPRDSEQSRVSDGLFQRCNRSRR